MTRIGYIVEASGHGGAFRLNVHARIHPTAEAAQVEADRWIGFADTIGGDARVVPIYRVSRPGDA
jgi:hypothetical protein